MVAPKALEEQLGYLHRLHTTPAESKLRLGLWNLQARLGLRSARTHFEGDKRLRSTLISLLIRYEIRRGLITSNTHSGRRDKTDCSNNRVKSNPPRQLPAQGPNVSSLSTHDLGPTIFAYGCTTHIKRCRLRDDISAVTAMYQPDSEMRSPAWWDNEISNRICIIWHASCGTAEHPNARAALGEISRSTAPAYVASFPISAWVRPPSSHTTLALGTGYSYDENGTESSLARPIP